MFGDGDAWRIHDRHRLDEDGTQRRVEHRALAVCRRRAAVMGVELLTSCGVHDRAARLDYAETGTVGRQADDSVRARLREDPLDAQTGG